MDETAIVVKYKSEQLLYPFRYAYEHIYAALCHCIIHFDIPCGSILKDFNLANLLGVSRTAVRQALFMLADNEIVLYQKGIGFHVLPFDRTKIDALYDYRRIIDPAIAKMAALNATKQQILELKQCIEKSRQKKYDSLYQKAQAYYEYEEFFHTKLAFMSNNPYLQEAFSRITIDMKRAWAMSFYLNETNSLEKLSFYKTHLPIYYAISINNPVMAQETMYAHLDYSSKY